jgi:WD40 repeat protein
MAMRQRRPARGWWPRAAALAAALASAAAAPPPLPRPFWEPPQTHFGFPAKLALTPDGRRLGVLGVCRDSRSWTLRVWDTRTRKHVFKSEPHAMGEGALSLAFLPGGEEVVAVVGERGRANVRVVSLGGGGVRGGFALPATCGRVSAVSPDGKRIVVSGDERVFSVYDLENLSGGFELDRLSGPEPMPITNFPLRDDNSEEHAARDGNTVTSLQFSPDSKFLAVGTRGGWVSLWDLKRRLRLWRQRPKESAVGVACLSFSPDGKFLASTDGPLTVLRASDGQVEQPPIHNKFGGSWGHFLADGKILIAGDPTGLSRAGFLGWDTSARRLIGESWRVEKDRSRPERNKSYPGFRQAVVSSDRRVMVTEQAPGHIAVWDLRNIWPR